MKLPPRKQGRVAVALAGAALALIGNGVIAGSTEAGFRTSTTPMNPHQVLTPGARRSIEQVQDVTRHYSRSQIDRAVRETTGGRHTVSSTDRGSGSLQSRNHDRGAMDVVTPYRGTPRQFDQAREISRRLGPNYTSIVEQAHRPARGAAGPSADVHTAYSAGERGNVRTLPPRASGTHIHVQPNYGIDVPWRAGTFGGQR